MLFDSVVIGCDHGGLALKEALVAYCRELGVDVTDCGTFTPDSVDYPVYADKVCRLVLAKPNAAGILCCGTGIGMSMAANKFIGIRAAVVSDPFSAEMTRRHNNANVLCLGGRVISAEQAITFAELFLNTPFDGGRHQRRVDMISEIEKEQRVSS
ncbi:MAG: ribose 5-phosphate isomerase B [Clostridia bacterium]|nr:ribose 5-phosphate isomerase B [Clostridia bacterium]